MARSRTEINKITTARAQKDFNLDVTLKECWNLEEGWYRGKITAATIKKNNLIVDTDIFDLKGEKYFGNIKGFMPTNYTDEDLTPDFLVALEHPKMLSEVIGKEAKVYVDFTVSAEGKEYANIYGYDKL